jgi:PPP family 3-phenylpropionic acid transporter
VQTSPFTLRLYYVTSFAALGVYLPLFPPWLEAQGVHGLAMGLVSATLPAMGILGPPVFGAIADALGMRGSLLRVACAGGALAMAAIAIAAFVGKPLAFGGLLVACTAFAFFRSPMVPLADVLALELERDRGYSYGRMRLFGSSGFLVAVAIAGRFVEPRHPVLLPAAVAILLLFALGSAWLLPAGRGEEPPRVPGGARDLLAAPDVRLFLVTAFLGQCATSAYDLCFSLRVLEVGGSGTLVGTAWAFGVVAEVVLMAFAPSLFARVRAPRLAVLGLAAAAVRWLVISRVTSPTLLFALQPLHGLQFAAPCLGFLAWTRGRAPAHLLATMQGLFAASAAAGSVLGMLTWGALQRRAGTGPVFLAASAVAGVAFLVALRWAARTEGEAAAEVEAVPAE